MGRDFDHKEVTIRLGGVAKKRSENIYKNTTIVIRAKFVGKCAMYDMFNEHLREPLENIRITLGEIEQKVKQISTIYNVNDGVLGDEVVNKIEEKEVEIEELLGGLPGIIS